MNIRLQSIKVRIIEQGNTQHQSSYAAHIQYMAPQLVDDCHVVGFDVLVTSGVEGEEEDALPPPATSACAAALLWAISEAAVVAVPRKCRGTLALNPAPPDVNTAFEESRGAGLAPTVAAAAVVVESPGRTLPLLAPLPLLLPLLLVAHVNHVL